MRVQSGAPHSVAAFQVRLADGHTDGHGRMDDLGDFADGSFDLVVALGVYHCATRRGEWDSALAETARVLRVGGRLLVAIFTPETDLTGEGRKVTQRIRGDMERERPG